MSVRIHPFVTYFDSRFMVSRGTLICVCNFHTCLQFSRLVVLFLHGRLQFSYEFAILIRVCNSHVFIIGSPHNIVPLHRNQYECQGVKARVITTCKLFDIFAQCVLESNE